MQSDASEAILGIVEAIVGIVYVVSSPNDVREFDPAHISAGTVDFIDKLSSLSPDIVIIAVAAIEEVRTVCDIPRFFDVEDHFRSGDVPKIVPDRIGRIQLLEMLMRGGCPELHELLPHRFHCSRIVPELFLYFPVPSFRDFLVEDVESSIGEIHAGDAIAASAAIGEQKRIPAVHAFLGVSDGMASNAIDRLVRHFGIEDIEAIEAGRTALPVRYIAAILLLCRIEGQVAILLMIGMIGIIGIFAESIEQADPRHRSHELSELPEEAPREIKIHTV